MTPFGTWLVSQKDRADDVGTLAQDAGADVMFPLHGGRPVVYLYLRSRLNAASEKAYDKADREYRDLVERPAECAEAVASHLGRFEPKALTGGHIKWIFGGHSTTARVFTAMGWRCWGKTQRRGVRANVYVAPGWAGDVADELKRMDALLK